MIDLHAHMWPRGLLEAVGAGGSWFGWEGVLLRDGTRAVALGDRLLRFPVPEVDLADASARAARRLAEGVTTEAVMPVGFLWGEHLPAVEAIAMAEEINDELAATQAGAPEAFRGVGLLPLTAPAAVERVLAGAVARGIGAVAIPTNVGGLPLDDPRVLPSIELVLDAGVAAILHPTYLGGAGAERMPRYYLGNTVGAPLECTLAALALIHAGVLDRHPGARILVVNAGGCLPYESGRHARRHRTRPDVRTMARPTETYLPDLYYDSLILDEASLRLLVERVGASRVVLGTDHPFRTDVEGGSVAWIGGMGWLTPEERDLILRANAARFLGLGAERPGVIGA